MPIAKKPSASSAAAGAGKGQAQSFRSIEGGAGRAHRYEVIFDQASDAIFTVTGDGKVDAINHTGEEMTGYLKSELIGMSASVLVPDPSQSRIPERSRPLSLEFFTTPGTYEDVAILRKDGYVRQVDISVRLVRDGKQELAIALLRDLTERKQMERELITKHTELKEAYFQLERKNAELQVMQETLVQAGKMAALGELAAGIAHELNQPLQGIRGYAQEMQSGFEAETGLREIISSADKMAQIIDHLRTFTRKSTEMHEETDVHARIEEAFKLLQRQFASRGISVHRDYQKDLPAVYANPLQIEQVFINLATNARDAIEATGRGSGNIWVATRRLGEIIEIRFRDDGAGMSDKTKAKAFNPFFTTKEVGKGMGLGLSLSYGMISKLHGSIMVESELGKGAEFIVRLPRDFRELA